VQAVAESLAGRGHTVTVVTLNAATQQDMYTQDGAGLPSHEVLNGVRVHRVAPGGGRSARALRWWLRQRGGWRSTRLLLGEDPGWFLGPPSAAGMLAPLLFTRADVVVSANWHFSSAAAVQCAGRVRGLPVVGLPLFHIARPWADRPRYRPLLRGCSTVIALTEAEAGFVRARGALRVEVIGCGVDPARFASASGAEIRRRHKIGDRPVVGFIGRQDTLKGVPTLIEAMRLTWKEVPESILLLAGQSAHRDRETQECLNRLDSAEREKVRLVDDFPHEEGPHLCAACDLVAIPSVEESFGLVFLEGWMVRRPVIGVRIPSTVCVIEDGQDGLIANPMDPVDLARAILRLIRHPGERAAMGERGHQKAVSRFTLDRITDRWEEVLVARTGRRSGANQGRKRERSSAVGTRHSARTPNQP